MQKANGDRFTHKMAKDSFFERFNSFSQKLQVFTIRWEGKKVGWQKNTEVR